MTINIQSLCSEFCNYLIIQKQRSKHTVASYALDIKQWVNYLSDNDILTKIDSNNAKLYVGHLKKLQLQPASIHRKLSALDHFFEYLIQKKIIQLNPWKQIRRPKIKSKMPVFIEEDIVLELLDNYPTQTNLDIRNKTILELLFVTGIRVTECANLTIQDFNFQSMECRIRGKGNKDRIVLFGKRCLDWLCFYHDQIRIQCHPTSNSAFFISKNGQPITNRTIQRIVKDANQYHSSNTIITPHVCRHSCASMLLTNGAGIRDIQELLGHSSINTTQRYANIPSNKLTERFLGVMNEPS